VFCHVSVLTDGNCLREGDTVEYEVVYDDRKGKYRADKVTGARHEREEYGGGRDRYDDRRGGGGCECPPLHAAAWCPSPRAPLCPARFHR
jgi:hypothetical protein